MTVSTTAIDLSPILQSLIQIAGLVLTGVATWAIARVAQLAGLGKQTALKQALTDATGRAITWGESQVGAKIGSGASIETHNAVVATAANYLISKMPDTLKSLGYTPQSIEDWIVAHLPPPVSAG